MYSYKLVSTCTILTLACGTLSYADSHENGTAAYPMDAAQTCALTQTTFDADWTKITFPNTAGNPLAGMSLGPVYATDSGLVYIFPPDGPAFTDSTDQPTDCAFHKWSAQMFLWLTSSVDDVAEIPTNPGPPSSDTDYVFASEFFYRLEGFDTLVPQGATEINLTPLARDEKNIDSIGQAGFTNGVLFFEVDTETESQSDLVYYDIHVSRPYGYVVAANNAADSPLFNQFLQNRAESCVAIAYGIENDYFGGSGSQTRIEAALLSNLFCSEFIALPSGFGSDVSEVEQDAESPTGGAPVSLRAAEAAIDYLAMTMELKTSWVRADSLAAPGDYIQQSGTVPVYGPNDDGTWSQTGEETVDLAMIGMHVVGSVADHPEMIWATFEHVGNAPDVTYPYVNASGDIAEFTNLSDTPNDMWLLSDGTFAPTIREYAVTRAVEGGPDIIVPSPSAGGAPLDTPTNVNRLNPWGSDPSTASAADNNSMVISTNTAVLAALNAAYGDADISDPRRNYILTGSSWGHNGMFPTGNDVSQIAGTPAMANTTMETFQQADFDGSGDREGCFTCHGINPGDSGFDVSHIFSGITTVEE
ncbi:hypothetical protein ACJ5NV_03360 [Loktanella agnita]|uniref:hypothetical protein n=1 Tax=Loktanella agnita TaxID=287097 RepID=UPI0039863F92